MEFSVEMVQQYAPAALADLLDTLTADLSAAEVARDAFATEIMDYKLELNSLREEVEQLRQHPVLIPWSESERTQLLQELAETRAEVERLKAELAWVTETELGLAKQKQNLNRAKLQAVYDALAEHCQTAKHPSPLLLEQLQSLYRLLEDPA